MKHFFTAYLKSLSFRVYFFTLLTSTLLCLPLTYATAATKKIAIIVPAEIQALEEITQGFKTALKKDYAGELVFKVANTQGDLNLLHATIQSLRDQNYQLIVPIGSNATSMTISMIKKTPILSLASDFSDTQRKKLHPCNVAVVQDEISSESQLNFMHKAFPNLKKVVLLYSPTDEIFTQVEEAKKAGDKFGITIMPMMVSSLPELQTVANNMPQDTQAIFILKDMQIVGGISQIQHIAQKRQILLMSSDDGSVKNGAGFSLGVYENQIGIEGALLAAEILTGKNACVLPIKKMKDLTVFINSAAMKSFGISSKHVKETAKKMHYQIEIVKGETK